MRWNSLNSIFMYELNRLASAFTPIIYHSFVRQILLQGVEKMKHKIGKWLTLQTKQIVYFTMRMAAILGMNEKQTRDEKFKSSCSSFATEEAKQ